MTPSNHVDELFDTLARVLLRCFVLGYLLLLAWAGVQLFLGDWIAGMAERLVGLTAHEVALVSYCGITAVKCVVILFFLFPYAAIRMVVPRRT